MFKFLEKETIYKRAVLGVFLICLAYWGYLIFSSSMQISWDAIGYEKLGLIIYEKGWKEFFITGPHREPLYPFVISLSMGIADYFSVSYQLIQKIIQVVFLFVTQILTLLVLNKLRIKNAVKLLVLLYFGFSPAIVNSALALYSEIIVFPFVPAAVLLGVVSWQTIQARSFKNIVILSLGTSCIFILATFGKAIFQHVFTLFLIPYFCISISSIRKKNKVVLLNSAIYILIAFLVFNSSVVWYKSMNKKFNNKLEFTNRYVDGLFGCVAKRAEKLTSRKFFMYLASIPGEGVCRSFFSDKECRDGEYHRVDYHSRETLATLLKNTPKEEVKSKTIALTFKKAMQNPFQQILLIGFEMLKMPFWESTQIGYVFYPSWLENLFNFRLFKDGLRLIIAILTYCSIISLAIGILKKRNVLIIPGSSEAEIVITILFIFLIIVSYTGLYSLFLVITRYILPIAPLYIISIAYFFNNRVNKGKSEL